MKLKELRHICAEAERMFHTQINILRRGQHETVAAEVRSKLMLADALLLKRELKGQVGGLRAGTCHTIHGDEVEEYHERCRTR
jgi:hypothetical protein